MEVIKSITIETFIKPMKNKKLTHGIGELDGERLEINLDNLFITFGNNHFACLEIWAVIAISSFVLFVIGNAENYIRGLYFIVVVYVNRYIKIL